MSSSGEIPVITTLEQRIRVATANPNHNTSCDLVELPGDTMELLLSSVLEKLQNKQFTDETMEAVVGNVVPEAIAQVLEVEDVGSKSTENLNRLIVKHVMEKMKSNFYSSKDPAVNDKQQITDMYRINVVAQEAADVKKELIFRVCTPHLETKKIAFVNPLPLYKEGVSSVDSRRTQETRSVKGPQTDREELVSSVQTEELADSYREIKNQDHTAAPSTKPKSEFSALKRTIKRFFTKYFRKHSAKVAPANLPEIPETSCTEDNPTLNNQVNDQKRSADTSPGEQFDLVDKDSDITPGERLTPLGEDANITYVETFIPEDKVSEVTSVRIFLAEEQPAKDTQVQNVEPEPKFYETTHVEDFILEVEVSEVSSVEESPLDNQMSAASVVKDAEIEEFTDLSLPGFCPVVAETTVPQATAPADALVYEETQEPVADVKDEGQKASVSLLVHSLIAQAIQASNICCSEDLQAAHGRLLGKVWAKVQGEEIHVGSEEHSTLNQKIHDNISKKMRCPREIVGVLLVLENPILDKQVVASFLKHLRKSEEKPSFIMHLYSSGGKAIRKPFRQTGTECLKSIQLCGHLLGWS
ncbi:hypothetical protein AMECASPLE_031130 [Ameca splendens]|uniref:Uncharacterized protein n=1 Tax=Ameca splendens TaxID=208324 RepID=A0ABV0YIE9_9TELE